MFVSLGSWAWGGHEAESGIFRHHFLRCVFKYFVTCAPVTARRWIFLLFFAGNSCGRISRAFWGNEKCERTFFARTFEHPQGSRTSRQNSWDIPDSSLRNPRKTNFRGWARTFRPPPLRETDPHPTGRSPDPKSWSLCSFSCLNFEGRKIRDNFGALFVRKLVTQEDLNFVLQTPWRVNKTTPSWRVPNILLLINALNKDKYPYLR